MTNDTTPSFRFSTQLGANCRIGKTNVNWTSMGSIRDCSSTGGISHTCTVTTQDELVFSNDIVYFGCKNVAYNNQSITAAQMNLTGLGDTSSNAIELGIRASEVWPGASIYTNQKV